MDFPRSILFDIIQNVVDHHGKISHQLPKDIKTTSSIHEIFEKESEFHSKSDQTNSVQIKVLRQKQSNICGYHTFHNLVLMISACCIEDPKQRLEKIKHLNNRNSFWYFYHHCKKALHQQGLKMHSGYPWDKKSIDSEVLEREHAKFLIHQHFKTSHITDLPEMSMGSLINGFISVEKMEETQKIFDQFQKKKNFCHGFIIGALNHWFGYVINKTNDGYESYLLDSRNVKVLGASKEKLLQIVKKRMELGEMRNDKKKSDWERKNYISMFLTSLLDTQHVVDLLYLCAIGKKNFVYECHKYLIKGLINSFNELVNSEESLKKYFENHSPPKIIEGILRKSLSYFKEEEDHDINTELSQWLKKATEYSKNSKDKNVQRFKEILKIVEKYFKLIE